MDTKTFVTSLNWLEAQAQRKVLSLNLALPQTLILFVNSSVLQGSGVPFDLMQ